MVAFLVHGLKVRTLDLDFFIQAKKKLAEGKTVDYVHRGLKTTKYPNSLLDPAYVLMVNYGGKVDQIVRVKLTFFQNGSNEVFFETSVDYF
jgi:hypothetical protein